MQVQPRFKNNNSSCYIDTVLLSLFSKGSTSAYLESLIFAADGNIEIIKSLFACKQYLQSDNDRPDQTEPLRAVLKKESKRAVFQDQGAADSREFLLALFEEIKVRPWQKISHLQWKMSLENGRPVRASDTKEVTNELLININPRYFRYFGLNNNSLSALLDSLKKPPPFLALDDIQTTESVEYAEVLIFSVIRDIKVDTQDDTNLLSDKELFNGRIKLLAVVAREGGHYVAYLRTKEQKQEPTYYLYDDASNQAMPILTHDEMLKRSSKNSLLLFYGK